MFVFNHPELLTIIESVEKNGDKLLSHAYTYNKKVSSHDKYNFHLHNHSHHILSSWSVMEKRKYSYSN